jgi:hypothetical protein
MSIRTWVFLALLVMTLLGVGGISAAHAEEDINCDNGRFSNDDSDTAECVEEKKRQEEERKEEEEEEREKEELERLEAMFRAPIGEFPTYNEPPTFGFPSVPDHFNEVPTYNTPPFYGSTSGCTDSGGDTDSGGNSSCSSGLGNAACTAGLAVCAKLGAEVCALVPHPVGKMVCWGAGALYCDMAYEKCKKAMASFGTTIGYPCGTNSDGTTMMCYGPHEGGSSGSNPDASAPRDATPSGGVPSDDPDASVPGDETPSEGVPSDDPDASVPGDETPSEGVPSDNSDAGAP